MTSTQREEHETTVPSKDSNQTLKGANLSLGNRAVIKEETAHHGRLRFACIVSFGVGTVADFAFRLVFLASLTARG
eukprot:990732-Amphidinium_carterae.1